MLFISQSLAWNCDTSKRCLPERLLTDLAEHEGRFFRKGAYSSYFVISQMFWTNSVTTFTCDRHFGLLYISDRRRGGGAEWHRTMSRKEGASRAVIPTPHGTSFRGFGITSDAFIRFPALMETYSFLRKHRSPIRVFASHMCSSVIIYLSVFNFVPCLFSSTSWISCFKTSERRGSCEIHVRSATRPLWWWQ